MLPALPEQLKGISHFLKVAAEHETRDPVVAYWARFHGVQKGLEIDKSSAEAKKFLFSMLDWLEKRKKELSGNEAVTVEAVAEAHIENYALKLFNWADSQDRQALFNKNVVKGFYTSSILLDVLENFGELNEEFEGMRKYGRWKAAYIHSALKNGQTPLPGPVTFQDEQTNNSNIDPAQPQQYQSENYIDTTAQAHENGPDNAHAPVPAPAPENVYAPTPLCPPSTSSSSKTSSLSIEEIAQAQKYCKWASSALNFDDVPTAIENLRKALSLLEG